MRTKLAGAFMKSLTLHQIIELIPMLFGIGRSRHGKILREMAKLYDAGTIKPFIDEKRFKFSEIVEAHKYLESGAVTGKVSITPDW
jgi:NADPH2:quinone reductase